MGMLDFFTGGSSSDASNAIKRAGAAFTGVATPTTGQLTLPELQKYVQAGLMTPAEAQAYLQESNAYNTENIDQTGTAAQIAALNKLSGISDAGPMGTPIEQAQIGQAIDTANQQVAGQRGAIEQQMEAKGTPAALVQAALMNEYQGQDASQAHRDSLQAQAQAYQAAVNALAQKGALGGQLQGQQNVQANTVAAAQNAMQEFNARNQQAASEANATRTQAANLLNTTTRQDISNKNTEAANRRTQYNAAIPQTIFEDSMEKAKGVAGAAEKAADVATGQGQQNAGLFSGLLGAGANIYGDYMLGNAWKNRAGAGSAPIAAGGAAGAADMMPEMAGMVAKGGILSHDGCYHDGGICLEEGGMVPGKAKVPGDSLKNDRIHVMASPGEAVIPRSAVQRHLPEVTRMIAESRQPQVAHHPQDIASLLQALRAIRSGAA